MTRLNLFYLFSVLVLTSCGTSQKFMADDIYVMKPNALPLGESSADETSYTAFKQRKEGRGVTQQVYANQASQNRIIQCYRQPYWTRDCGCSYTQWMYGSPFSSMNQPAFGMYHPYGSWGHPGFSMSMNYGYNIYGGYNNFYSPYYSPYYNPYYGYNSWNNPYYGYNYGYGFGGNSNSWNGNSGTQYQANHHNGPRGSSSGYVNPEGRSYAGTVKSGKVNTPLGKGDAVSTNGRIEKKPIETIPNAREVGRGTVTTVNRGNTVNRENTVSRERVYTNPNQISRESVRSPGTNGSTGRPTNSGSVSSPSRGTVSGGNGGRVNSGSVSSPNRSSGGATRSGSSGTATPSRRP